MSVYKSVFEAILSKLEAETHLREKRALDVWICEERACVQREINHQRAFLGKPPVSIDDVERAERTALGHSDYTRKFAHAAADLVFNDWPAT